MILRLRHSLGWIVSAFRSRQDLILENLALRQQLAVLTRTVKRPQLRSTDRLFWFLLTKGWRDWRSALVVVQPVRLEIPIVSLNPGERQRCVAPDA